MGTRGVIGLYKDGKTKVTYNHYDSYPSYLGVNFLNDIKEYTEEEISEAFDRIIMVDKDKKPTKEQIKQCKKFCDLSVSSQSETDWYCLLRNAQGNIKAWLDGEIDYMIDSQDFLKDSLFCEWGYIVNLDERVLEVWTGFSQGITKNRYMIDRVDDRGFGNCVLIKKYPLFDLP
jgi:hypothetical protein